MVETDVRAAVRQRASGCCEYCGLQQKLSSVPHHVEHIIPKKHGGTSELVNLALACHRCNLHKGCNLAGLDPITGELVRLFHPRQQIWSDHFVVCEGRIHGRTATGRATVTVLAMNDARRVEMRQLAARLE